MGLGLFDLFKKNQSESKKATIPEQDKKYYQQDSYYTDTVFTGTQFEKKVVLFENRKKTAIPSKSRPVSCGNLITRILLIR